MRARKTNACEKNTHTKHANGMRKENTEEAEERKK